MSEVAATETPNTPAAAETAPPQQAAPQTPPEQQQAPQNQQPPNQAATQPAEGETNPSPSSPSAETTPAPQQAGERSLADIYADIQADKPVRPGELARFNKAVEDFQSQQQELQQRAEKVAKAFPETTNSLVDAITQRFGLDEDGKTILSSIVEKSLLYGDGSLQAVAAEAVMADQDRHERTVLQGLGVNDAILNRLPPENRMRYAFELGRAQAPDPAKWVSVADKDAAVAEALRIERESHPERVYAGGNGNTSTGGAEPQTMRDVRLMHIGQHPSGRKLTTQEMRAYESRNYRGDFPD